METVFDRLAGKRILSDMMEQEDLTRVFMALLHSLCDVANRKGVGLESISFSTPQITGHTIKATALFGHGGSSSAGESGISGDVTKFFMQKNARCARALEKNPRIEIFWEQVLTLVRNYAIHKHGMYEFTKVSKAIITPDNVISISL